MKKLLIGLALLASMSAFAEKKYCLDDNESEEIFVYSDYQSETPWHIEDSYQGEEIGHLKNGKKTYFLKGYPNHFLDGRIPIKGEFNEIALEAGIDQYDVPYKGYVVLVTQDEKVLKYFLSLP